ncbi:afadin- and alpha-actinin-binding protein B-like [Littorina saxatilis]
MADWKLLSFYTASSGPGHRVETSDDGYPAGMSPHEHNTIAQPQEIFCTENNVSSCVSFLNQELQLLGLPAITCNNKGQPDVSCLLNGAYDLHRCYQRIYSTKEELENRIQRLSGERDHHKSSVARVKRHQEELERTLSQETEKLRQLSSRHKITSSKVKADKDEIKCLQSVMQHKDLQFKHELKKKEKEVNKLKDRLHQMLMDKNPDRKVGMDMMNTVQNAEGKRAQWKPGLSKQEEDMYQMLVGNYEERHRELVLENTELRDCLLTMQRELSALLKQNAELSSVHSQSQVLQELTDSSSSSDDPYEEPGTGNESFMTVAELSEGYHQMPYDMVRREIERAFKRTCETIGLSMKKTWKQKPDAPSPSKMSTSTPVPGKKESSQEVQHLHVQLAKYKDIIQQQEKLIQQSLQTHSDSFLHESQLLHQKDALANEKKLFYEEKAHFEEERKLFTEAAIRLGRERKAIQDEKMKFLKENFLNITPFRQSSPQLHREGGTSRLLPVTPHFSPAPEGRAKPKTPNTAELLRALGLADLPREGKPSSTPKKTPKPGHSGAEDAAAAIFDDQLPTASSLRTNLFSSPGSAASDHSVKSDNH